ncbi:MAG: NAD-dependent epimerase/dehydratase family protein [Clostridiales bacterium]|jgi:nucleoside-diphosphate-sugar epimerase|nr:NAD-dependent epimerase/dehydratase family protein [Clostridiales bacterium]
MKKVLITGGGGFVGGAVLKALMEEKDVEVHALHRKVEKIRDKICFHQCDLMDYRQVNRLIECIKPDYLVHLAWNVEHSTYLHSSENLLWVGASLNLLKCFAENKGRRVFMCGTCFEQIEPLSLYAVSKRTLCQIAWNYCETRKLSFVWGRLFYLYGEGEKITRVVPYAITELLEGHKVICKNASAVRDYMYVKDAGNAIVKTLLSKAEGVIDIASGKQITMAEIFEQIGESCERKQAIILQDNPVQPQKVVADVERLRKIVGFNEDTDIAKALSTTIQWWRENKLKNG